MTGQEHTVDSIVALVRGWRDEVAADEPYYAQHAMALVENAVHDLVIARTDLARQLLDRTERLALAEGALTTIEQVAGAQPQGLDVPRQFAAITRLAQAGLDGMRTGMSQPMSLARLITDLGDELALRDTQLAALLEDAEAARAEARRRISVLEEPLARLTAALARVEAEAETWPGESGVASGLGAHYLRRVQAAINNELFPAGEAPSGPAEVPAIAAAEPAGDDGDAVAGPRPAPAAADLASRVLGTAARGPEGRPS